MRSNRLLVGLFAAAALASGPSAQGDYALAFQPGDRVETVGPFTQLDGLTRFTLEAEVTVTALTAWTHVLSRVIGPMDRVSVQLHQGKVYCIVANGANSYAYTPSAVIAPNVRRHIAMVFDGASSTKIKLYVDGVLQPLLNSSTGLPAAAPTSLANFRVADGSLFEGVVDEVRVWSTALSASVIKSWRGRSLGAAHPEFANLQLYWGLDDHLTPAIAEASLATGIDGVITGAAYVLEPLNSLSVPHLLSRQEIVGGFLPYYKLSSVSPDVFNYLTHLYYFSLGPSAAGELGRIDSAGVFTPLSSLPSVQQDIATLLTWRRFRPTKIMLVVGGWVQSDYFDEALANAVSRANLVANIKSFCVSQGIDGVDIDWEGYNGPLNDTDYGLFVSELRGAFSGTTLLLSVSINPSHTSLSDEFAAVDFVQIMSYGKTIAQGTQVPLSKLASWVDGWVQSGLPESKLVVGLPAYGRTTTDNSSLPYVDIVQLYDPATSQDAIVHNGKTYYYNGVDTVMLKAQYALDRQLRGVMFWELGQDTPVAHAKSLLGAVNKIIPVGP